MRKCIVFMLFHFTWAYVVEAQPGGNYEVATIYRSVEKNFSSGNYESALADLKRSAGPLLNRNDSLLYLKIKILEPLQAKSNTYTKELDSTLQMFLNKVNRYSFSEIKYAEVTSIRSGLDQFKERDRIFYDSVMHLTISEKPDDLTAISARLSDYIKVTPNSYYYADLASRLSSIDRKRKRLQDKVLNKEVLRKVGKTNVIMAGISFSSNRMDFSGFKNEQDASAFFQGKHSSLYGSKYSINASLINLLINVYNGSRVKAGIAWSLLDAEYTVFDWTKDTVVKNGSGQKLGELKSIKAGTRIGPMVTVLLNRQVAAGIYYQARPSVLFLLDQMSYSSATGVVGNEYELKPKYQNFSLTHEVGIRFYFFKRLMINPFLHFGKFNWVNEVSNGTNGTDTYKSNYSFQFTGIRIGI